MPRPRPLTAVEARRSLVNRFGGRADRLRQLFTRFGLRSRRVFLVWTQTAGEERGAGSETIIARREILPTPRVADATSITRRPISIGIVPDGSLRVDQISAAFTEDNLRGKAIPPEFDGQQLAPENDRRLGGTTANPVVEQTYDFFYEIVEDGRGDDPPARVRFKLLATPWRNESGLQWGVFVEPEMGALDRDGLPTGTDDDVLDM